MGISKHYIHHFFIFPSSLSLHNISSMQAAASSSVSWPQTGRNIIMYLVRCTLCGGKKIFINYNENPWWYSHSVIVVLLWSISLFKFGFNFRYMAGFELIGHPRVRWLQLSMMTHHSLGWSSWDIQLWGCWGSACEGGQDGEGRPPMCQPPSHGATKEKRMISEVLITAGYQLSQWQSPSAGAQKMRILVLLISAT